MEKVFDFLFSFAYDSLEILLQQLYNVVDTLIVGQTIGAQALSAVGSSLCTDGFIDICNLRTVYGKWRCIFTVIWC